MKGDETLAEASSVIACVNGTGEVQRIPEDLVAFTSHEKNPQT
jgi:acyl-CoA thioesterase FadM